MKPLRHPTAALNLPTLKLEGGLFLPDVLAKAAHGSARLQSEADYHLPKGLQFKDEIGRAFQIACAQWRSFAPLLERADYDPQHTSAAFISELLRDALGYPSVAARTGITLGEGHEARHYPITHWASAPGTAGTAAVPIVVAPHTLGLDEADPRFAITGSGSRKKTAFQLAQELLNASPAHLWAMVTNGKTLRLLRDAATLTRPAYLEFDLQDLLAGQRLAEFAFAWRLLHASRAPIFPSPQAAESAQGAGQCGPAPTHCAWEAWREAGQEEGTRVRNGLRAGVTQALLTLGQGFVQHPANQALRQALQDGSLSPQNYFAQLLRLIYRCIFTFSVEERGLIPAQPTAEEAQADPVSARAKAAAAQAYASGYALARLRDLALRRRASTRFDDLWQAVKIVFHGLGQGQPRLGLPALGGLFAAHQCPHLDAAQLTNADLLAAMHALRWAPTPGGGPLAPIDYRNMGTEELGSVYESLLELVPEVDLHARRFGFVGLTSEGSTAGNDRKLTGSYYTPDSLVQELIRSALDPVIAQRLAQNPAQPVDALLAIRVIDPACGSGHFLLAAARRLAEKLAQLRAPDGAVTPQAYRHALREVVGRCIFGVDRNPMAIELARTALWLEGFEEGRPLGFLDHHLQVGDALLGLTDLQALERGIAKDAFKPLSGDDKEVCKALAKTNAAALKQLAKDLQSGQHLLAFATDTGLQALQALEALGTDTTEDVAVKERAYYQICEQLANSPLALAADLAVGAYLLPKTADTTAQVPTSITLHAALTDPLRLGGTEYVAAVTAARAACQYARVLHWPLAFPQVFAAGGFDCVLGNPPWERIKLQEEEFFATRHPAVANASNKAERSRCIEALRQGTLAQQLASNAGHPPLGGESEAEQRLYAEFISARRTAEASSVFMHVDGGEGGRYPLTGVGDVNTYALFAETILQITAPTGRAGFIVPTGIATDDSTKAYFGHISQSGRLVSLYDIENRSKLFAAVDSRMKFCLITLGQADAAEFVCFAEQVVQLADPRRRFTLTPDEFRLINPNTLTCPIFRTLRDAELTKKLYRAAPVLIKEGDDYSNPWQMRFHTRLFHMAEDSHLFLDEEIETAVPLYEAKMVHQFDHRWSTYNVDQGSCEISEKEKADPGLSVKPRYWISSEIVTARINAMDWNCHWLIGWRDVCRSNDVRTLISSVIPKSAVGDKFLLMFPSASPQHIAALLANLNSLCCDFVARQKVGGTSLKLFTMRQLPIFAPSKYKQHDLSFIIPRVLELTYTAHDLASWARDLGHNGPPFPFAPERRAQLRAELDAYYARLYGLTRDELRYLLDPAAVLGEDYPSETFRVLKNKELREFGEYRTQRLVLAAWDARTEQ